MRDVHISNAGITTVPIANATVILWDSTIDPALGTTLARRRAYPSLMRAVVRILVDQPVTFKAQDLAKISTSWRVYNGGGAGEVVAANAWFERDVLFDGDDHQLVIVVGATPPTVWEVSVRLSEDRTLAQ